MHTGEKPFECKICHRKFAEKVTLLKHQATHSKQIKNSFYLNNKKKSKVLQCDVCLKSFSYSSELEKHYRSHTGEKPFACQICGRKFATYPNLVRHQTIHSDVRNFKCSFCPEDKFFKSKSQLSRHMILHSEPKFSCNYCDYKTHYKANLVRHLGTHYKTNV